MTTPETLLRTEGLSCAYAEVQVLFDISLTVPKGHVTCVMGRNGVGKTTLMNAIMGLLAPSAGTIQMGDTNLTNVPAYERVRGGLAYVPQGRMIFPRLSVEENIKVGFAARRDRITAVPDSIYDLFPILRDMAGRMGGDLSGGQQQQLAIARALVTQPQLLILDEPTEGIQPNIVQHIGEILRRLVTEQNITVLIVEQYLDFVREYSQHFYVMNRGRIVVSDETANLEETIITKYLSV
jgi:urea transport system ATP-binding protein